MPNRTLDSDSADGRSPTVRVVFPEGLLSLAQQHAHDDGVTLSEWIRDAVRLACADAAAIPDASGTAPRRLTEARLRVAQRTAAST